MTTLNVQLVTKNDIAAVAELFDLYRQFYEQQPNPSFAFEYISQRFDKGESIVLIAQDSTGQPVGFCQIYPTFCSVIAAPIFILSDLFVLPSARRLGAGKQLLLAAEEHAKKVGVARMDLTTAKTNVTAQTLYESLGWQKDTVFIAYNRLIQ